MTERSTSDLGRAGIAGLVALVVGLGVVVVLAMPKADDLRPNDDAGEPPASTANGRSPAALEQLGESVAELAVLTAKPMEEAEKLATPEEIAKLLDPKYCGGACDAVRKLLADKKHCELQVQSAADYILPAKDSWATIAPALSTAERESIAQRTTVLIVRTRGDSTIDQLPARAAFAAAAAAADALSGFVYDEVVRRIERADDFRSHVITLPLGQNVFSPRHIMVQIYRDDDGTARLLSLGMVRFGSSDFTMEHAPPELATSLANVLNAVAYQAAGGATEIAPLTIAEVARANGRRPEDLAKNPSQSAAVPLETTAHERVEGDPENDMLELVPHGGGSRDAWASVATELFGYSAPIVFAPGHDPELDAIAVRAKKDLPGAVKRFAKGDGALFVKGPFPIPEESRIDGGASEEWMWMQATTCDADACTGPLSNTPGFATNLAAGKEVSVNRNQAADWMLQTPDGGTAGGASIRVLEKRATGK